MIIEVKEVKKSYVKGTPVLKGVSLKADENEIVGLVGMNGAGKSTLMRLISGISRYDSGKIIIDDTLVGQLSDRQRRRIQYFCAKNNLYQDLKLKANLEFFRRYYHADQEDAAQAVERLELKDMLDKRVSTFSSGMYQRASLAVSTLGSPRVLLLDEPTAALDIETKAKVIDYIRSYKSKDRTIIITSHNIKDIEELCERVYILKEGCIIKESTVSGILHEAADKKDDCIITLENGEGSFEICQKVLADIIDKKQMEYLKRNNQIRVTLRNKQEVLKRLVQAEVAIDSVKSDINNLEDAIMEITH